jgi:hypothetical protein
VIKALLYRMSIEDQVTETDINKKIEEVSKEIIIATDEAEKAVLQIIFG